MLENQKVLVKNMTNHKVGFTCVNFPNFYEFNGGQVLPVKWEHLEDAAYSTGVRYMFENAMLRIEPTTENYSEVMENLQLSHLAEQIDNSLGYAEAKKLLSVTPLAANYAKIKNHLEMGTATTKENIAKAALELKIKDYMVNTWVKKATNIDVIKALELNEAAPEIKE